MRPPLGMVLVKFPEGLNADMDYQLRERDYNTLEDMKNGAVSVEENLIEKKERLRAEKRVTYRDENVASTSDPNNDRISKNVEKLQQMVEKMVVTVSNLSRNQNHNQNQNFRRNNATPNRQRESDQQVISPFQENFC